MFTFSAVGLEKMITSTIFISSLKRIISTKKSNDERATEKTHKKRFWVALENFSMVLLFIRSVGRCGPKNQKNYMHTHTHTHENGADETQRKKELIK